MIHIFDDKSGVGGGQVVLRSLLTNLQSFPVYVDSPIRELNGLSTVSPPNGSGQPRDQGPRLLLANSNSSLPNMLKTAFGLRRRRVSVRTVAIVHNYARSRSVFHATRLLLRQVDHVILVEPGLQALSPCAEIPAWLTCETAAKAAPLASFSGQVKAFARPDRSKGLDLLPTVFSGLAARGVNCAVALGHALDGDKGYEKRLRRELAPWLVADFKTSSWIDPGDIFVVPSRFGEAACLSAQEALLNGAYVAASRLGLMPYLNSGLGAVETFPINDSGAIYESVSRIVELSDADFLRRTQYSQANILSRQGLWYRDVMTLIARTYEDLLRSPGS